jgi:hypothetical protein
MLDRRAAIHHDPQPAGDGDARGLPTDDAELEPQHACTDGHGLFCVRRAEVAATEDVDEVDRAGGLYGSGQGRVGGDAEHLALARVDRDALVAMEQQVAHDPMGRPGRIGGGTDDGYPPRGGQGRERLIVVEQGHLRPALGEVDQVADLLEVAGARPFLGQAAASRS